MQGKERLTEYMDASLFYKLLSVVNQTKSITKAAELLGYSQSGLSHAINRFEKELGFVLLIRHSNGVSLTNEAQLLLPIAKEIERNLDNLNSTIQKIKSGESVILTVGTFASIVRHFFPAIISEYEKKYPFVKIHIKKGSVEDIQSWIINGSIDIAITSLQPEDHYNFIKIIDEQLLAVVPKEYAYSTFKESELKKYHFIAPANGNFTTDIDIKRVLDNQNFLVTPKVSSTDWSAIPQMVETGIGISILPTLFIKNRTENVNFIQLDPKRYRTLVMTNKAKSITPEYITDFMKITKERISKSELLTKI